MSYDVDQHGLDPAAFTAQDVKGVMRQVLPVAPAVILTNPKYPHNLGQCVRALSCFGVHQLWWTGERVTRALVGLTRIPREERMRGYADVSLLHHDRPLDHFVAAGVTPVAVEYRDNAENLFDFIHPERAVYVFGPEDGGLDQVSLRHCHRFVKIPTKHCTNLSAAVYLMLYDRAQKLARPA